MLSHPDTKSDVLFGVGLFGLMFSPAIVIAGLRLPVNRPNRFGGLFGPNVLRAMAIVYGIMGGIVLILAIKEEDIFGIYGSLGYIFTTQGAFVLANLRGRA
ncbi:hypothetical protein [Allohahella marinimesophila]